MAGTAEMKLNYLNKFEIDTTPDGGSPTWATVAAGITSYSVEGNEENDQVAYYDGEGLASSEVTGGQLVLTFEGHRAIGDAAQDYIAGLAITYGAARHTQFKWTQTDASVLTGDCTIVNIQTGGGDANSKGDFSFEIHFNGKPTLS